MKSSTFEVGGDCQILANKRAKMLQDMALKSKEQLPTKPDKHHISSLSRVQYLKMVFDWNKWRQDSLSLMSSTISGIYGTLLVCIYIAFAFTELVKFPDLQLYLEKNGFFTYLFALSNIYFVYLLILVIRVQKTKKDLKLLVVENEKSHGSVTVRFGAIVFGLGTFAYFLIELLDFLQHKSHSPCYFVTIGVNTCLALLFVFLQTYVIFMYPRLNIMSHTFINRMATMHVVATNFIIWIRTLIKESLEEIEEYEVEQESQESCDPLLNRMLLMEELKDECRKHSYDFLPRDILSKSSPYLYPFIIEYSLIGASVAYIMSNHIGFLADTGEVNKVHKPSPIKHVRKSDFTHTFKGTLAGICVLCVAIVNLALFFNLESRDNSEKNHAEYLSKASNTAINLVGIIALIIGIAELHHLEQRSVISTNDLDMFLLRFTSFFSFMYMIFTIITGAFNQHLEDFPNELHIVNGVCDLIQVILQLCFIQSLKQKAYIADQEYIMPGRQITVFLFLFNLAQWIVFTFEIQKVRASRVEEEFYHFMPWVLIQRVTLPLAVFFRFHSAVVSIELWKEVYASKQENNELNMSAYN